MGYRIMILEDDPFIALDLQDMIEDAGYEVVGPIASRSDALSLLEESAPDCALLDFNVRGGTSEPVARKLDAMGVPFVFVSANTQDVKAALPNLDPVVRCKPVRVDRIVSDVEMMLA